MSSSLVNCQNGQEKTASVLGFTTCRDRENLEVIQKGVTEIMMGLESRSSEQRMWQWVLFFPRKGAEVGGDREYMDIYRPGSSTQRGSICTNAGQDGWSFYGGKCGFQFTSKRISSQSEL